MSGTLATNVHVYDADGVCHVFGPTDTVPSWAYPLITNPLAWASGYVAPDEDEAPKRRGRPPKPVTEQ